MALASEAYDRNGSVWVFNGNETTGFPSGVFANKASAENWIANHRLSGTLTRYPIGFGVYDLMVSEGLFQPRDERHETSEFIGSFSSAHQEHYHYREGVEGEDGQGQ